MADWSTLHVGESIVLRWRNALPNENEEALSFVFRPTDRQVRPVLELPGAIPDEASSEGDRVPEEFTCWYEINVAEAVSRLRALGLDGPTLDRWISGITGVPQDQVEDAVVDSMHLRQTNPMTDYDSLPEEVETRLDAQGDQRWENLYHIDQDSLGCLVELRYILRFLDGSESNELVWLEMDYAPVGDPSDEELASFQLFTLDYDGEVKIERDFMGSARAHYSIREFDLVYIELAVALEEAMTTYLANKFKGWAATTQIEDPKRLLKRVSASAMLQFVLYFRDGPLLDDETIKRIEKVFELRNAAVHRGLRTFDLTRVSLDMNAVQTTIQALLPPV